MSYRFEMSNVKDSLTQLFRYVSETTDENAWKIDPIISDLPTGTSIKFPHPSATVKDLGAKCEPFSSICIHLSKPYVPQLSVDFSYDNKKAALRFSDMFQEWNKNICNDFFTMVQKLDGFSFKLQVKTTFKKKSSEKKQEDIFVAPACSVSCDDVIENFKKVTDLCSNTEMMEDDKAVKCRVPCILICRDFSIDDLALENSPFDEMIAILHKFMLLEPKILSEKDLKKTVKVQKKVSSKEKFNTILSNRADEQFYCRLTNAEFERQPENLGIQVWNQESYEMKKYIKAALKLVKEI
ncbi:MAG: hypothetical protein JW915_15090 [Chitinispirillaceae bacterium]|nr:hypothetical protein [Chitinispirillaceae bacterium]